MGASSGASSSDTGEQATVPPARFLTPGEAGILANLRREAEQIAALERQLVAAKKRRDLLIVKARRCSIPERQIEPHAGVSNVRVGQIARAWEAAQIARDGAS